MRRFESIITVTLNPAIDRIMRIDGFAPGTHKKGETLARVPAGKGVNVSRVLDLLGVPSIAVGLVGRGQLTEYEDSFRGTRIRPEFLAVEGHTRENVTVIDSISKTETHIRDEGMLLTESQLGRIRNKINLLAKPSSLVVFSGSLPPGVMVEQVVAMLDIVSATGAAAAVDGPAELLRAIGGHGIWLVKPNIDELLQIVRDDQAEHLCRNLSVEPADVASVRRVVRQVFPETGMVIISNGARGGYLFSEDHALAGSVTFDPSRLCSTVGCGDCLLAAFIAGCQHGAEPVECFRYALAAATAAGTAPEPGFVEFSTIDGILPDVTIVDGP